jgi:gluconate 2-dehydrogenase gamma chain
MSSLTRRQLLAGAAVYGGGAFVALHWPRAARAAQEGAEPLVLSPHEWKTVEAIAARIVPSDDGTPGATEAGCVNFIDKALAHEDAALRPSYTAGLRAVDEVAKRRHGGPFALQDAASQDALLAALQDGKADGWPAAGEASPDFFETLRTHTLTGFLADPKYGGNRDYVGWKHVGYPGERHGVGGYTPAQMAGTAPIRNAWHKHG